jgi:hypothetical protein
MYHGFEYIHTYNMYLPCLWILFGSLHAVHLSPRGSVSGPQTLHHVSGQMNDQGVSKRFVLLYCSCGLRHLPALSSLFRRQSLSVYYNLFGIVKES